MREQILQIQRREDLDNATKTRMIQDLMMKPWRERQRRQQMQNESAQVFFEEEKEFTLMPRSDAPPSSAATSSYFFGGGESITRAPTAAAEGGGGGGDEENFEERNFSFFSSSANNVHNNNNVHAFGNGLQHSHQQHFGQQQGFFNTQFLPGRGAPMHADSGAPTSTTSSTSTLPASVAMLQGGGERRRSLDHHPFNDEEGDDDNERISLFSRSTSLDPQLLLRQPHHHHHQHFHPHQQQQQLAFNGAAETGHRGGFSSSSSSSIGMANRNNPNGAHNNNFGGRNAFGDNNNNNSFAWLNNNNNAQGGISSASLGSSPSAAFAAGPQQQQQQQMHSHFHQHHRQHQYVMNKCRGFGKSFHDEENQHLGCKHYQRGCKLRAPCCGELFTCRFCHDEAMDHTVDRTKVQEMYCMHCSTIQPVAQQCHSCGEVLGTYFCSVCRFFDSDPTKSIYHCPHCGICRIGKGLGIDFFHCEKCHACMHISLRQHKCVERSLESNCPICSDFLFTSTIPVMFLPCGHCMHSPCYQEYVKNSYTCPVCSKSLTDMSSYFRALDDWLESETLPPECANRISNISCADCERRSSTKFHFEYHKCGHCGSYNTKVVSVEVRAVEDIPPPAAAAAAAAPPSVIVNNINNNSDIHNNGTIVEDVTIDDSYSEISSSSS